MFSITMKFKQIKNVQHCVDVKTIMYKILNINNNRNSTFLSCFYCYFINYVVTGHCTILSL